MIIKEKNDDNKNRFADCQHHMCEADWHEKVVLKPFVMCPICGSESFHSPDPDFDIKVLRKKANED